MSNLQSIPQTAINTDDTVLAKFCKLHMMGSQNKLFKNIIALRHILTVTVDRRVDHIFTMGKKKRPITVPTKEFSKWLKAYLTVLQALYFTRLDKGLIEEYSSTSTFTRDSNYTKTMESINWFKVKYKDPKSLCEINLGRFSPTILNSTRRQAIIKFDLEKAFSSVTHTAFLKELNYRFKGVITRTNYLIAKAHKYTEEALLKEHRNAIRIFNKILEVSENLFVDGYLPQGFCTSSYVFELLQTRITPRVLKTLGKLSLKSTKKYCKCCYKSLDKVCSRPIRLLRYIDDFILFIDDDSHCKQHLNYWLMLLRRVYRFYGFRVNRRKFAIYSKYHKQYIKFLGHSIAGNNVKGCFSITRRVYKKIDRASTANIKPPNKDPIKEKVTQQYLKGISGYSKVINLA